MLLFGVTPHCLVSAHSVILFAYLNRSSPDYFRASWVSSRR